MTWQTKKIDDVCEVEYGTRVVNKKHGGSIYPVYGGGGATFHMDSFNREDRMVIARFAMSEQCVRFVKGKFFLNDSGLTVAPKNTEALSQDFLDLQLLSLNSRIYSLARGSAQKNLDVPAFREMEISYPDSISEQEKIVKTLKKTLDDVAKIYANTIKSQQNSRALFESYLQKIFTISEGSWEQELLSDISDIEYGYTEKAKTSGDYRFVRITDTDEKGLLTKEDKMYVDSFGGIERYLLNEGDLVMARTGASAGNVLFFEGTEEAIFASYLIRIKLKKEILSKLYWYFSKSQHYWNQVRQLMAGSAQPQFNGGALKQVVFVYPKSISDQKAIVKKLDKLSAESQKLENKYEEKLVHLEELRKSLLHAAFSQKTAGPAISKSVATSTPQKDIPSPYVRNQVHAAIVDQVTRDGGWTTEVAVAKYDHLLQEVFGLPLGYEFQAHQFGPFDTKIKRLISSGLGRNKWFTKRSSMIIFGSNVRGLLFRQSNLYRNAQSIMRQLSSLGITRMDADSIELLSTICHSIKETQSNTLSDVRDFMSRWQTDGNRTKAEKFSEERTQKCLDFLLKHSLHQRLLQTI